MRLHPAGHVAVRFPRRALCVSGAAAFIALPAAGADGADERLGARLETIRAAHRVPAVWAGRFHADGRAVVACTGVRREGDAATAEDDDPIHIGSCTKAMTAAMIARECSAGRLDWESTLGVLFPDDLPAASPWSDATVEGLLRHTSGAPANADWDALHAAAPDDPVAARRGLLSWLASQPRPAHTAFAYSNVGYALLGHAIEVVRGEAWESLVTNEVFAPLGIAGGGFGPVPPAGMEGAWGHVERDGALRAVRVDNPPPLGPAGRVHVPMRAWASFVLAFVNGGTEGRRVFAVSQRDWDRLLDAGDGTYAGGWGLHERDWGGGRVLSHAGSNTTWYCVAWVAPERDFCLLGATNCAVPAAAAACDAAVAACLDVGLLLHDADGG